MTRNRFDHLMQSEDSKLTQQEIDDGWHFCNEFDGLLVQGDPNKTFCDESCIDGAHEQKLT